jgi:hypothetical protein
LLVNCSPSSSSEPSAGTYRPLISPLTLLNSASATSPASTWARNSSNGISSPSFDGVNDGRKNNARTANMASHSSSLDQRGSLLGYRLSPPDSFRGGGGGGGFTMGTG